MTLAMNNTSTAETRHRTLAVSVFRGGVAWIHPATGKGATQWLPSAKATPLTTAVTLLLALTALLLRTHPGDLNSVVAWASTNVNNLEHHPVAAMLVSTFVVPGNVLPELVIVAASFAALERAIGAWRTALIALLGQVIATLLTEYGADLGAGLHLFAQSPADRADVGVSYVMYSVLAACALSLTGRARLLGALSVGTMVIVPFLLSPGMTTSGHVLSVAIGATSMTLILRHTHLAPRRARRALEAASP